MITPIRGRKLVLIELVPSKLLIIRNDNPDKGTETVQNSIVKEILRRIRNDNPDKGTETDMRFVNLLR